MSSKRTSRNDLPLVPSPTVRAVQPGRFAFLHSLAGRLTLWYCLSTVLLVAMTFGLLYAALSATFDYETDDFLKETTATLKSILSEKENSLEDLKKEVDSQLSARRYAKMFVRVLDSQGKVLVEAHHMSQDFPQIDFILTNETDESRSGQDRQVRRRPFRLLSTRIQALHDPNLFYVVQIAYDRKHESGILHRYRTSLWLALSATLIACSIVGFFIARRGIDPVQQITHAAGRVTSSTLDQRLQSAGLPTELRALAGTFNGMLDRLEDSFRRVSQFSGDIAHELRTPLNNLRGEMEVAMRRPRTTEEYRDVLGSALEECERLTRLVDRLLFIARIEDADTEIELETLNIARELSVVREFYDAAAAEAQVELALTADEDLTAELNRELFQSAIGNLIANALRHTSRNGSVRLSGTRKDNAVVIAVSDTGCGIAAEHLPHVFDRFYRVDVARSTASGGVGLGLALVRSIATLHNAKVDIQSEVGKGTSVTLTFPVRSAMHENSRAAKNSTTATTKA
jgi:two-component system heavy metal sensor histidine kinase CusS